MSLYGLDPVADARQLDYAARNPAFQPEAPTFTMRTPLAAFGGIVSGGEQLALAAGEAATPAIRPVAGAIDKMFGTSSTGWLDDQLQQTRDAAVSGAQTNPYVYGTAGDIVHGAADFMTRALIGKGAGGTLGVVGGLASSGPLEYQQQTRRGVDAQTATELAALRGAADVVGGFIPLQGQTLLGTLTRGVGSMTAAGAIQRGTAGEILRGAGYPDMAKQYEALDGTALATDALMGLVFGGFAHGVHAAQGRFASPDQLPQLTDAAITDLGARHIETTAPGLPADPTTRNAHISAVERAIEDSLADRPVDVTQLIAPDRAHFVADPGEQQYREQARQAIIDELGPIYDDIAKLNAEAEARGLPAETLPAAAEIKAGEARKGAETSTQPEAGSASPEPVKAVRSKTDVEPARDSLSTAIAKLGGLNADEVRAEWGAQITDDRGTLNKMAWAEGGPFGRHVMHKGGVPIDRMVEALAERGYLDVDEHGKADFNQLHERLAAEAGGERQFTAEGIEANAERATSTAHLDYPGTYEAPIDRATALEAANAELEHVAQADKMLRAAVDCELSRFD